MPAELAKIALARVDLDDADVLRLGALATCADLELDLLALVKRLEALAHDVGVVNENIVATCRGRDETKALLSVEELDSSSCHVKCLLSSYSFVVLG
jgi:hypothetical protein